MRSLISTILLTILCTLQCTASLVYLNETTFDATVSKNDFILVKFITTENCRICKEYAREFNQLSIFVETPFGSVDCDHDGDLCERENITAVPTTILYRKGVQYRVLLGLHEYGEIKFWLQDMLKPSYYKVDTQKEIDSLKESRYTTVVAYFQSEEEEKNYHTLLVGLSNELKRFKQQFVWIVDNAFNEPTVQVFNVDLSGDTSDVMFPLTMNRTEVEHKLTLSFIPPFSDYQNVKDQLNLLNVPVLYYIFDSRMSKATLMKRVAIKYQLEVPFVVISKGSEPTMTGHSGKVYPCLSIIHHRDVYPYDESQPLTEEGVSEFVQNVLEGKQKAVKRARKTRPDFMNKRPPIITSDVYSKFTSGNAAIVVCPFSDRMCTDYIADIITLVYAKFQKIDPKINVGVVDIDEDDVVDAGTLESYPALLVFKDGIQKTAYSITQLDPVEVVEKTIQSLEIPYKLTAEESYQLRMDADRNIGRSRNMSPKDEL